LGWKLSPRPFLLSLFLFLFLFWFYLKTFANNLIWFKQNFELCRR
jgi:hypothetical protein